LFDGGAVGSAPFFLLCNGIKQSTYPIIPTDQNTRVPDDHRRIWWWMERTRKPNGTGDGNEMRSVIKVSSVEELHHHFSNAINFIFHNSASF
jgi:hypothetical protein